jgi:hypothetical protein
VAVKLFEAAVLQVELVAVLEVVVGACIAVELAFGLLELEWQLKVVVFSA